MQKKNKKTALITGVTGMDGSYLAQYLLSLGYKVYGLVRYTSKRNYDNIKNIMDNKDFKLVQGDLCDSQSLLRAVQIDQNISEVYNLAAMSHVGQSFKIPEITGQITGLGCLRLLQAIRQTNPTGIKYYNASTSELFGKMVQNPANENTPFYPRSPYGVAKLYGYWMTKNYRESYNMFTCNGILFNHESFRRGLEFLPKKIVQGVCDIVNGKKQFIELGNLQAKRDWGSAELYVRAMHLMLQQDKPDDYVVATGQSYSVRQFLDIAFNYVGISDWKQHVKINPEFYRPCQVDVLRGDATKIKNIGWNYDITFEQLVHNMIDQEFGKPNRFTLCK